jgi:hypothetical protein
MPVIRIMAKLDQETGELIEGWLENESGEAREPFLEEDTIRTRESLDSRSAHSFATNANEMGHPGLDNIYMFAGKPTLARIYPPKRGNCRGYFASHCLLDPAAGDYMLVVSEYAAG